MADVFNRKCYCIFSFLFLICASVNGQSNYISVNAGFAQRLFGDVTSQEPYIFHYAATTDGSNAVRVTVNSMVASVASPILVIIKRARSVLSWQVPLVMEEKFHYNTVSRTLCPMDNTKGGSSSQTVRVLNGEQFYVEIMTLSSSPIRFSIFTEIFPGFHQRGTCSFELQATPSAPQFVLYELPDGVDRVLVKLRSEPHTGGNLCGYLSIQTTRCPVTDLEADRQLDGRYQTVTTQGAIQVSRAEFGSSFYIAVLVKPEDSHCTDRQGFTSLIGLGQKRTASNALFPEETRFKTAKISVVPAIGQQGYVVATVVPIAVFLAFFLIVLIMLQTGCRVWKAICCVDLKRTRLPVKEDTWLISRFFEKSAGGRTIPSMWEPANYKKSHILSLLRKGKYIKSGRHDPDLDQSLTILPNDHAPSSDDVPFDQTESTIDGSRPVNLTSMLDLAEHSRVIAPPHGPGTLLRMSDLNKISSKQLTQTAREYGFTLMTVFLFYSLPVLQLVITHQTLLVATGNQDLCYYNFSCSNRLGIISDFNHIISNAGYVLLGILFLFLVRRRAIFTAKLRQIVPDIDDFGIPSQLGLFYGMGLALVMEGFMSASYHVCPSYNNFQFDTSFMYLISGLLILKLYHSRHPDILPRSYIAYMLFAGFIFIALVGVLSKHVGYWIAFSTVHGLMTLQVGLQICFVGYLQIFPGNCIKCMRVFRCGGCEIPVSRIVLAVSITLVNFGFVIAGPLLQPWDFATHLLFILQANLMVYAGFYAVMKIAAKNEKISRAACLYFLLATPAWLAGMYFFTQGLSDWEVSAATSREGNRACFFFNFYDEHDVWHMLSAFGLFFTFMMLLTLDDDLATISRADISVF